MVARRDFLRKAAVTGTSAFVVPTIVTVDPADAQALTSPPPEPPGREAPASSPPVGVAAPDDAGNRRRVTRRTELPRTGADLDRLTAAGLAATAGGAALVLWSARVTAASESAATASAAPGSAASESAAPALPAPESSAPGSPAPEAADPAPDT
jgi:hypothetical protein